MFKKILLGVLSFVAVVAAHQAFAGDDLVQAVSVVSTGCSQQLAARRNYAVACKGDAYVKVSSTNTDYPTTDAVKVPADKLYDTPTTQESTYICFRIVDASTKNCSVFINRKANE